MTAKRVTAWRCASEYRAGHRCVGGGSVLASQLAPARPSKMLTFLA